MLRRIPFLSILVLLTLLAVVGVSPVAAQGQGRYFPETGHYVSGDFQTFYDQNPYALILYGYPITEQMPGPLPNQVVQYFQRARLEMNTTHPPGRNITVSPLGSLIYVPGQGTPLPISLTSDTPGCQQQPGWDFPVCYAFFDFYLKFAGDANLGRPIAPLELYGDRLVQYFEKARLEWHPENLGEFHIEVAHLGREYFFIHQQDPSMLMPVPNQAAGPIQMDLQVRAFTEHASLAPGETQTVFITVSDIYRNPINGAFVTVIFEQPGASQHTHTADQTSGTGFTSTTYTIPAGATIGEATITIKVSYYANEAITTTSFHIWH